MNATLKIDPQSEAKFRLALGKIVGMAGKEKIRLMMEQMTLLVSDAAKLTPPFGNAPITEKLEEQRRVGEMAIRRDLLGGRGGAWSDPKAGIFKPLSDSLIDNADVHDTGTVRYFTRKDGSVYGSDVTEFRPDASTSEMHDHHQKYRRKDGRVTSAGAKSRDIGRWKSTNALVVRKATMDAYLKLVFAKVLIAKSGWVYAWTKFQAALGRFTKSGKKVRGIPAPLRKLRGAQSGHYVNAGTPERPVMEAGNIIPYVQRFAEHVLRRAWSNRVRNIQKQAKRMEQELAKRLKSEGIEARANT